MNLYSSQVTAYRNAKAVVKNELDEEVSEGEIVRELAHAYTGIEEPPGEIPDMVDESASEKGDSSYSYDELQDLPYQKLRQLAAEANTHEVNGKSPHL